MSDDETLRERIERLENKHFSLAIIVAQVSSVVLGYVVYLGSEQWLGRWAIALGVATGLGFGIALVREHDPIQRVIERLRGRAN